MVFNLARRLINISYCQLACKNISHILRFALISLNTPAALYLISFNIYIHHAYILCSILSSEYCTGTFFLTLYSPSTFFIAYLLFLTLKFIQRREFFGLKPLKRNPQFPTSFIAPK